MVTRAASLHSARWEPGSGSAHREVSPWNAGWIWGLSENRLPLLNPMDYHEGPWLKAGWWLSPTPLKNMKVSWGYYSQYMESHKSNVPNHQPESDRKWPFMAQIPFRNTYDVCSSKKRHSFYPDPWLRILLLKCPPGQNEQPIKVATKTM